jgi:uncharacterized protein
MASLDALRDVTYVNLTTFRHDGSSVGTPVWVLLRDGRAYVRTGAGSYKVKRIRANARVEFAPSDSRGREKGERLQGTAVVVPAEERPDLWAAFHKAHPILARLDELRHRSDGFVFVELAAADQPVPSSNASSSA